MVPGNPYQVKVPDSPFVSMRNTARSSVGRHPAPAHRFSPILEISLVITFVSLLIVAIFSLFMLKRERDLLYLEKINAGKIVLGQFVASAIIPLLGDDLVTLNTMVKKMNQGDGLLYAVILDNQKNIRAHTDPAQIGLPFKEFEHAQEIRRDHEIIEVTHTLSPAVHILDLSKAITYTGKPIGRVHLGLSLDLINRDIEKQTRSLLRGVYLLVPMAIALAIVAGVFLGFRVNRPDRRETIGSRFLRKELLLMETGDGLPLNSTPSKVARNQVTVLFAGIKGFKAYANTRAPEQVFKDLNECLGIASECITECGGYIDRFVGDAVIGVFGNAPLQTDHTARAVRSAVAIQKALEKRIHEGNELLGMVGIGISTGVVLSSRTGAHDNRETVFIGESFKAAYLLNVMAGPGEIVLSKEVYQLIEEFVRVEPLPPREIMQRTEPWQSFRLHHVLKGKSDV